MTFNRKESRVNDHKSGRKYQFAIFKEFVKTQAAKRNLSMRKLSQAIGMAPSYFSEILNGKKKINPSLLNSLADYFQMPRVDVYQAAGWLDYEGNDFIFHQQMSEWFNKDPYYREAVTRLIAMDENQRNEVFTWLFQKTTQKIYGLEESEIKQELVDNIDTGSLQPELFDQLSPKQRQILTDTTQLFIEAFLAKNAKEKSDKEKMLMMPTPPKKDNMKYKPCLMCEFWISRWTRSRIMGDLPSGFTRFIDRYMKKC